jgi:pyridoxamine 5'-phosphate oxidase
MSRWMMTSVTGRRRRIRRRDILFQPVDFFIAMEDFPPLDELAVERVPLSLFTRWYNDAVAAQLPEPNAMTVATAQLDGTPAARIVLLRGFGEPGFDFYTNFQSRKGAELAANPRAALVLFWAALQRQIRVEGHVDKLSAHESDLYFQQRPLGHRLGTLVSPQSRVIPGRAYLEERMEQLVRDFPAGKEVPRPENWGGYRVVPHAIEFWQGRPNRLHDRLRYRRVEDGSWVIERLAP